MRPLSILPYLLVAVALVTVVAGCASRAPERFEPSPEFRARTGARRSPPPRVRVPNAAPPPYRATGSAAEGSLARTLEHTFVPGLIVDGEESLRAVVDRLRAVTGLPLVVDERAERAAADQGARFSFDLAHPLSARDALELVTAAAGPDVAWTLRDDAVLVTTRDRAHEPSLVVAHDVQDLALARTDFVAPRIDRLFRPQDSAGGEPGPFGGEARAAPSVPADELVQLVTEHVEPASWDDPGRSIDTENGFLIVVAPRSVQVRVRRFLDTLRGF